MILSPCTMNIPRIQRISLIRSTRTATPKKKDLILINDCPQ
jgi:hypothetical protein